MFYNLYRYLSHFWRVNNNNHNNNNNNNKFKVKDNQLVHL